MEPQNVLRKIVDARCPECGVRHTLSLAEGKHLVTCELEEGGCDRDFLLHIAFVPKVITGRALWVEEDEV